MAYPLRYNTASQEIPLGYFVDSTDGNTEETGLTIANTDIKLHKAGATTLVNKNSGGATHISNGIYYAVLDDTDSNTLGGMVVFVHVAGALCVRLECEVLAQAVYDARYGSGNLPANVKAISDDTTAADNLESYCDGTTPIPANATQISGDGTAADNLEAGFDGTGYAGGTIKQKVDLDTIKTQAVTCAAGVTVLASVGTASASTAQTGDVGSLITTVGSAGAGLTNIPNPAGVTTLLSRVPDTISLAAINAEVDTALNTAIPGSPTADSINERVKAIDDKLPAGSLGDATAANQTTILSKTNLIPASPAAVSDIPTASAIRTALEADGSKLDHLWETTEDDTGVRRFTANALEQSPAGTAPTAVQIRQEMDSNSTQLAAIVADTGELQARFANMIEADGADWRFVTNALENSPTGTGGFTSGDRTTIEDTKALVQALL